VRLLVFGGWGQLGTDLALVASGRHDLVRPRHSEVDVTDPSAVRTAVEASRPDAVINAAAFHKVELCEADPDRAYAVNSVAPLHAARAGRDAGARSVFISTDYVFDGSRAAGYREDDAVGPLNVYGLSKAAGEAAVRQADPAALVVRGSGLFGHAGSAGKGGNFVDNMIARARAGEVLSVVDDQQLAPTATHDMAERILLLLEAAAPAGIYHAANGGSTSWFGLARRAIELAGVSATVKAITTAAGPVRRPAASVLLDTKSAALGLPPNRSWEDALQWYLEARPAPIGEAR